MRLLNCALWHLREGRVQPAYECLASAASCGADAKTLAAVAATCTRSIGAEKLEAKDEAQLHAAVRDMCGRVVAEATRLTTTYSVELTKTPLGLGLSLADDFVTEVKPDSQAARDGRIKVGDRVVAVNGEAPTAAKPSSAILQATGVGTIVKLEFTMVPTLPLTTTLEGAALADLCVAVADVGGLAPHTAPAAWAAWALQHVPHAKLDTLSRLVLHCKAGAKPPVQEYYDAVVKASFEPKWKGGAVEEGGALAAALQLSGGQRTPMAACFIIDRTWAPILQAAINATAMVFEEQLQADDVMALYGLGQNFLIEPTRKGGNEAELLRVIKGSNKPGGACKLYSSMSKALKGMAKQDPTYSKWLIVLTDLVDLGFDQPAASRALAQGVLNEMNRFENLNLAIIDSEAISGWDPKNSMWPTFRSNAQMLVGQLSGSNKGYHLKADNEDEIREAFAQVASMMGGMNETL